MGGSTKSEARSTRILAYTWDCSGKCGRLQPFSSAVVMKTAVLWVCWRSTAVHSVIPAEKRHKYPLREPVRSTYYLLFTRTLHAACTQQKKTRNNMAENGGFYGRETNMKPNSKWSWPELRKKKRAWRLNWRYFEGASRPLIPVLHSPFYSLFVSRFVSMAKKKPKISLLNTRWNKTFLVH